MALPTAQLGQLGTMSMPYSMPTYDKGPNIWEKALAAFLVNAAGSAAAQGTENLMSRDYAKEFDEKPAGVWSRLVGGPQVGAKDAATRRDYAYRTGEREDTQAFTRGENEFAAMMRATEDEARAKNDMLRQTEQIRGNLDAQTLQDLNASLRGERDIKSRESMNTADNQARMDAVREEYRLRGELPSEKAHTVQSDFLRGIMTRGNQPAQAPGVNPKIQEFGAGGGGPAPSAPVPGATSWGAPTDFVVGPNDIREMLASGLSPEEIEAIVTRQRGITERASGMPLPDTSPSEDPRLPELLQRLGMYRDPTQLTRSGIY